MARERWTLPGTSSTNLGAGFPIPTLGGLEALTFTGTGYVPGGAGALNDWTGKGNNLTATSVTPGTYFSTVSGSSYFTSTLSTDAVKSINGAVGLVVIAMADAASQCFFGGDDIGSGSTDTTIGLLGPNNGGCQAISNPRSLPTARTPVITNRGTRLVMYAGGYSDNLVYAYHRPFDADASNYNSDDDSPPWGGSTAIRFGAPYPTQGFFVASHKQYAQAIYSVFPTQGQLDGVWAKFKAIFQAEGLI